MLTWLQIRIYAATADDDDGEDDEDEDDDNLKDVVTSF